MGRWGSFQDGRILRDVRRDAKLEEELEGEGANEIEVVRTLIEGCTRCKRDYQANNMIMRVVR